MKSTLKKAVLALVAIGTLGSCTSHQSLQEYYVDSAENPNFLALDIPASILNLDKVELSPSEREVVKSLKKLNVLAFRKTTDNVMEFKQEKAKVSAILKDDKFVELMKLNSSYGKGVIKYLGDEDAIDEVVIYGNSEDKGFALIRILGNNMNPAQMMTLVQALQKSDYKGAGFGEISGFLKD
ncbi:MAG: DUF4252 domain-containing protein [Sediminicola sp.]|tara:strand:- start:27820 stop:28365 length:546 start_codon:yes stop_codon:yes gene_type:complete